MNVVCKSLVLLLLLHVSIAIPQGKVELGSDKFGKLSEVEPSNPVDGFFASLAKNDTTTTKTSENTTTSTTTTTATTTTTKKTSQTTTTPKKTTQTTTATKTTPTT